MVKLIGKVTGNLPVLLACVVSIAAIGPAARGQTASAGSPTPVLLRQMVGTWNVRQRMWPGPGAAATDLPPAIAHRQLIQGMFLEERMTLAPGSTQQPFTRLATVNYNMVNRRYEYVSLDTRAPQTMSERSGGVNKTQDQGVLTLYGGTFVASKWGKFVNATFKYRLTLGAVVRNRQVVRLYLTPQSGESVKAREFAGFEYIYTRR